MALYHAYSEVENSNTGVPMVGVRVVPVFRNTGVPGAGFPAPIFADQAGTPFVPSGYCVTDGTGMYSFYIEPGEYDLDFFIGSKFIRRISDFRPAEVGPAGPTGAANSTYETTTALEGADTTNVSAILSEPGKQGTFTIRPYADFIAQVAADTDKINYIRSGIDDNLVWVRAASSERDNISLTEAVAAVPLSMTFTSFDVTVENPNGERRQYVRTLAPPGYALTTDQPVSKNALAAPTGAAGVGLTPTATVADLASLDAGKGTEIIPFSPARNTKMKLLDWISVEDYGVSPTATDADNMTALANALVAANDGGRNKILFPGYDIYITPVWLLTAMGKRFIGTPGKTNIRNRVNAGVIRYNDGCQDLVWEDVGMQIDGAGAGNVTTAVIYSTNANLKNIHHHRCRISSPTRALNGVKIVTDTSIVSGIKFIDCDFVDILRMGIEVQAHTDTVYRFSDIVVEGGTVKNTTLQGVSLSGWGESCDIGRKTTFDNTGFCAIEAVGASRSKFTGTMQNMPSNILSFTGERTMYDNEVHGIVSKTMAGAHNDFRNQRRLKCHDNMFWVDGQFRLRNVQDSRFARDTYITSSSYGMYVEGGPYAGLEQGPSTKNEWADTTIDNSGMTSGQLACVRFVNPETNSNIIQGSCTLINGVGGTLIDNNAGAVDNWVMPYRTPTQQRAGGLTAIAFASDADLDVSATAAAPILYARPGYTISGTITAARTITLPANMPVGVVPFTNNCAFGVNLKVGATTVGPIAAGSTRLVYFPSGSIGILT